VSEIGRERKVPGGAGGEKGMQLSGFDFSKTFEGEKRGHV
jgi:hypothetical protein